MKPLIVEQTKEHSLSKTDLCCEMVQPDKKQVKFKKINSLKKINDNHKLDDQCNEFIASMKIELSQYDNDDLKYNFYALVKIYNKAVKRIVYGSKEEREDMIIHCVTSLLSPYFDNNELIVEMLIESLKAKPKLLKPSMFRRAWTKIKNFLFKKQK